MKNSVKCMIVMCFLTLNFFGCKKSSTTPDPVIPDTTKPTITIVKPTAGQIFILGTPITYQATFADNVKLGSYDIAITKVITSGFILKNVSTPIAWSYTKGSTSFPSGDKQKEINLSDITIPQLIGTSPVEPGDYNFTFSCVDAAGNIAIPITIVIKIN